MLQTFFHKNKGKAGIANLLSICGFLLTVAHLSGFSADEYTQHYQKIPLFWRIEQLCYQIISDAQVALYDENLRHRIFPGVSQSIKPLIHLLEVSVMLSEREQEAQIYLIEDFVYLHQLIEQTAAEWHAAACKTKFGKEIAEIATELFSEILLHLEKSKRHNREYDGPIQLEAQQFYHIIQ